MERRDVGELEAHREVGQLPRRARRRVHAARRAEERVTAGVEAPEAVLRHHALGAQARAEVREGHVAAQRESVVEPLERARGERAPQGLLSVALDAAAGHALDLHVGVHPRAVGRGRGEQLGDRSRLAALREGGRALGGRRALVAHRGEHGARARLDEDDRPSVLSEGLEGDAAQAEVDREPRGVALGQRRQPLRDAGQERRGVRVGLDPALPADDRDQGAVPIEEELAGAGIPRRQPADEPRPEAARCERHGARRGARAGFGLVAPLEREGRRVQVPQRVAGATREVGERAGGVEAAFRDGREDERLGREGFDIGEANGLGGRAPRPRRGDGSSRAGRGRGAGPASGTRERGVGGRGVAGQEPLPPPCEIAGGLEHEPGREAGGAGEGHEAPRREPAEVARSSSTVPASQAFVRAPASRAT